MSIISDGKIVGNSQVGAGYIFPSRNFTPNRFVGEWSFFVDLTTPFPDSTIYFDVEKINASYGTGYIIKYDSGASKALLAVSMIYKTESGTIKELISKYNCNVSFEDKNAVNSLILDAIYVAKWEFEN